MHVRFLAVLASGCVIGFGSAYVLYAAPEPMAAHTPHPMIEVDPSRPVPAVSLEATKDSKDGYNLRVRVEHFSFAPEQAGMVAVPNVGHAHLYVNGVKVARLYGEWHHLSADALSDGENRVEVTLNANDHSEWALKGMHVAAQVVLEK